MASFEDYWSGRVHAVLDLSKVRADWGRTNHCLTRVDAANRAFCLWYHGAARIVATEATKRQAMRDLMVDVGTDGCSIYGVSDLKQAFRHLAENHGYWEDDNLEPYMGGRGKAFSRTLVTAPEAITNFLDSVDDNIDDLREIMTAYTRKCASLNQQLGRQGNTPPERDWERIRTTLSEIKTAAERAQPLLWLGGTIATLSSPSSSVGRTARTQIRAIASGGSPRLTSTVSFLSAVNNIGDALTIYVDMKRASGGSDAVGGAFAALTYAMTYVPILGSFYAAFLQRVPGLVENFSELNRQHHARLSNPIAYEQAAESRAQRAHANPPWTCQICGGRA